MQYTGLVELRPIVCRESQFLVSVVGPPLNACCHALFVFVFAFFADCLHSPLLVLALVLYNSCTEYSEY